MSLWMTVKLLLRHPSIIPHLLGGVSSAYAYANSLLLQEHMKKPIEIKNTQGFDIYLAAGYSGGSQWIAFDGNYEPYVTRLFKKVLKKGSKVVDVGACIGWFTLLAARIVGEDGLVLSFEPEPQNLSLLAKSVEKNKFSNVKVFQEAVSDIDGTLRLNLFGHDEISGHNSIVRDFGGESILVQSSRLETVANRFNLDHIDLVKVDAEGAEPQVISGMKSLIDCGRVSRMVIEWNPKEWAANSELLSWLFEAFHIYRINMWSLIRLTKMNKESLPTSLTNLYLVKK